MWQCITSSKDPTPNICRVNMVIKFHIFFWQDPMHCISQLWGSFEAEIIFSQLWGSWGWGRGLNGNRMTLYSLMLALDLCSHSWLILTVDTYPHSWLILTQLTYPHSLYICSQLTYHHTWLMLTLDLCLQLTFALTIICLVFHCWQYDMVPLAVRYAPTVRRWNIWLALQSTPLLAVDSCL